MLALRLAVVISLVAAFFSWMILIEGFTPQWLADAWSRRGPWRTRRHRWKDVVLPPGELVPGVASFAGFPGTVTVEGFEERIARNRVHYIGGGGGGACSVQVDRSDVVLSGTVIRVRGGPVMVDSSGRDGVVLVGDEGRKMWGLRETVQMTQPGRTGFKMLSLRTVNRGEFNLTAGVAEEAKVVVLLGFSGGYWQHLMQDLIDQAGRLWDELADAKLLMSLEHGGQRNQLLDLLGLRSRILDASPTRLFVAHELIFVNKHTRVPGTHPLGIRKIRSVLAEKFFSDKPKEAADRFCLFERVAKTRMLRDMGRLKETVESWTKQWFGGRLTVEMFNPSTSDLADALRKVASCAVVVHVHGGLLYHSILMSEVFFFSFSF